MNCVFESGSMVPRGELYASYVDDLRHRYGALSGSVQTFTNIMRFIFHCFDYFYLAYIKKNLRRKHKILLFKVDFTPQCT